MLVLFGLSLISTKHSISNMLRMVSLVRRVAVAVKAMTGMSEATDLTHTASHMIL